MSFLNEQMSSEMINFLPSIWEIYTRQNNYTSAARRARNKYQVCKEVAYRVEMKLEPVLVFGVTDMTRSEMLYNS